MSKGMNTLFIFSDQHSKKVLGCYGNEIVQTPNIDKLAKEGALFKHAYCNNPICMPSRASMTIGDLGSRFEYWDNITPYGGETKGFGHRLLEEGYKMTTIGKLHFKNDHAQTGFADQRNVLNAENGIGDIFGTIRGFGNEAYRDEFGKCIYDARWGDAAHLRFDRETTNEAIRFLNEEPENDKPWILKLGYVAPHFPFVAPKEYESMYPLGDIPYPKKSCDSNRPKHPIVEEMRRYMGIDGDMSEETIRKARAVYYGMCSFLDDQIGRVLKALKDNGLDKNTRIIYTTDHGEMLGEQGVWYKELFYEESVGIPMIMTGPDIKPRVVEENVSLLDIYPTILDGVGIKLNEEDSSKPGVSLWPVARGEVILDSDRTVVAEYHADGLSTSSYMIKDDQYKFIYHVDFPNQLFDVKKDPEELTDLGQELNYSHVVIEMEKKLRKVIDPEETFLRSKKHQFSKMNHYGGHSKILSKGPDFTYTSVPEKYQE